MIVIDDVQSRLVVVIVVGRRWDVRDRLLPELDFLDVACWEEADPVGTADVSLEETAVRWAHHFDYVTGLYRQVSVHLRFVAFDAHDGCAWMSDWAGGWLRIGSDARWVADNIARIAEALIC